GLLLARIDGLPAHARQAIHEAAVLGPVFSERLLREVAADPGSLDQALAMLVDAELLVDPSRAAGATEKSTQSKGPASQAAGGARATSSPPATGRGRSTPMPMPSAIFRMRWKLWRHAMTAPRIDWR